MENCFHSTPRTYQFEHSKCIMMCVMSSKFWIERKSIDMLLLKYFPTRMSTTTANIATKHKEKAFVVLSEIE